MKLFETDDSTCGSNGKYTFERYDSVVEEAIQKKKMVLTEEYIIIFFLTTPLSYTTMQSVI